MKKRLLAMLLVLMMVVSLLPTGALAAGDGDTVDRLRLMNKEAWELAAIEKAGYSTDDVLWANITSARFFSVEHIPTGKRSPEKLLIAIPTRDILQQMPVLKLCRAA